MAIGLGVNIQKQPNKAPTGALGEAIVNGSYPKLLLDFNDDYYATNGGKKLLGEALTHSRSGNATMVDSDGLLKWAPHNLLTYSEDFTDADWTKIDAAVLVTSNAAEAPDGATTADQITIAAGARGIRQDVSLKNNGDFVLFVKTAPSGSATHIRIATNNTTTWNTGLSEKIALTSEWQIVSVSGDLNSGGVSVRLNIGSLDETGTEDSDCYGNALIWGAHLYRSDLGGMVDNPDQPAGFESYVPTTSSAVYLPRRGHHVYNGSAWVNEGLLHESEARTNLVEYSEDYSSGDWSNRNVSLTTGQASPDGGTNATLVSATTTDVSNGLNFINNSGLSSYTYSVFAKRGSTNWLLINTVSGTTAWFDLLNGTVETVVGGTATIQDMGDGWYRCAFHSTNASGANLRLVVADGDNTEDTTTGNSVYFYGVQLETAPTPSSYIPTAGATVTRAAETLTIPSANLPWSSDAVSIQMDGRMTYADNDDANEVIFSLWGSSTTTDRLMSRLATNSTKIGDPFFEQLADGVFDFVTGADDTYSPGILVPFNIASRHGSTFINGAVDGVALTEDTTPTALPDLSSTDLNLGYDYMGTIKTFRIWGVDLGDTGLETATAPSLEPSLSLTFDSSESSFVVDDWSA